MIEIINPKKIEKIARQIHESIPREIRNFGNDIEKKIFQILQAQLIRLNLVSREEFDAQTQILLRAREKINFLEQRLEKLENFYTSESCDVSKEMKLSTSIPKIDNSIDNQSKN